MQNPENLKYTKQHEWVRIEGESAVVGITDHAQEELGDITYLELPEDGKTVKQGDELAVIESVKAASDIYAPVGGTVLEANRELAETPETINTDPYGKGWICKLSNAASGDLDALMSAAEYTTYAEGLQ